MNENNIPWEDIMISGNVSLKGEKMSKSKGNVVNPKEVLEKYGADALRFWAAGSKLGGDLDYQEQDLVAGKKTITKLINASKFVFMNLEDYDGKSKPKKLKLLDEEFLKQLNGVINLCTDAFERYEYSKAKLELERFFWKDFCDNYLEIVKKRVYQGTGDAKLSAQYTLYKTLLTILKLFAPIMPFITEELYQTYFKEFEKDKSVHLSSWPEVGKSGKTSEFIKFTEILARVRQEKTNAKKSMNTECIVHLEKSYPKDFLDEMLEDFKNVTCAREVKQGPFKVEFLD